MDPVPSLIFAKGADPAFSGAKLCVSPDANRKRMIAVIAEFHEK
jgi:hypothetical protein